MANLSQTVEIIFQGTERMGASVDSVKRQVTGVADSISGISSPMASFTGDVLKFEAGLLAAGVAATGLAITLAGDFDAQFREIATLLDMPVESLGDFKDQIKDYAYDSTQGFDQVNNAVYTAISAGADYRDSLDLVAQAEQLAVAGRAGLGDATTVLVSTLNAYSASAGEAQQYSDLLFQTVRSGQTTLPELGASLANVTGLAATAGINFEELMSAVATLTATGSPTAEAVTQIKGAISNIIKPSKEAADMAAELGINFSATALQTQGFAGVLDDVRTATGGNVEQMAVLFGDVEALNGALTLTGNGAEKFAQTIIDMGNAAGSTEAAYEKMLESLAGEKLVNTIKALAVDIGTPLIDEFGSIQLAIAEMFSAIGSSVDGGQLQQFVDQIESTLQTLESDLKEAAKNLPAALETADYSGFMNGVNDVKAAFSTLFDDADITTVDGLVTVIETLGTGFELLSSYVAGAVTGLGPFLETLAELAQIVLSIDPEIVAIGGTIGGLSIVVTTVATAVSGLVTAFGFLAGTGGVISTVTGLLGGLITILSGPVGIAVAIGAAVYGIYEMGTALLGLNEQTGEATVNLSDRADEFKYLGDQSIKTLADLRDALKEGTVVWSEAQQAFIDTKDAVEESVAGIDTALDTVGDNAEKSMGKVTEAVKAAQLELANSFKDIIDSAVSDGDIAGQVGGIIDSINAALEDGSISSSQFDALQEYLSQLNLAGETTADIYGDLSSEIDIFASNTADGMKTASGAVVAAKGEFVDNFKAMIDEAKTSDDASQSLANLRSNLQGLFADGLIDKEQFDQLSQYLTDTETGGKAAETALQKTKEESEKAAAELRKAEEQAMKFAIAMEQIASDERIRSFELAVDLKTAEIEAETARIQAAFSSIDNSVTSTGQTIASLWETLANGDGLSFSEQWALEDSISKESDRRDQALELQKALVESQINNLDAKTAALKSGDGLIKISSDGLEPALEMIMWQVIEKVQLQANAEGAELLVGL